MDRIVSIGLWKFVLGAVTTIVVPTVVYCAIGGPVPPRLFVFIVQAGVIVGLVNYIRSPAAFAPIMETPTTSQDDTTNR